MKVIILMGMSGCLKSSACNELEEHGYIACRSKTKEIVGTDLMPFEINSSHLVAAKVAEMITIQELYCQHDIVIERGLFDSLFFHYMLEAKDSKNTDLIRKAMYSAVRKEYDYFFPDHEIVRLIIKQTDVDFVDSLVAEDRVDTERSFEHLGILTAEDYMSMQHTYLELYNQILAEVEDDLCEEKDLDYLLSIETFELSSTIRDIPKLHTFIKEKYGEHE